MAEQEHPSAQSGRSLLLQVVDGQNNNNSNSNSNIVSIAKTLRRLASIPSNRSCADCRAPLVDALHVYASFSTGSSSPIQQQDSDQIYFYSNNNYKKRTHNTNTTSFLQFHQDFSPPDTIHHSKIPILTDPPVDPAVLASQICPFGVFVCALCASAHKLLGPAIATVQPVHCDDVWTVVQVRSLQLGGGNVQATTVLEAYYSENNTILPRPTATSNIADRLTFVRAKYEALTFCLPPARGSLAHTAWERIVQLHPEWNGLWDVDDLTKLPPSLSGLGLHDDQKNNLASSVLEQHQNMVQQSQCTARTMELPDRLVDYFCVITASDFLHPSILAEQQDLSKCASPEDILLAPHVSDCFPNPVTTIPNGEDNVGGGTKGGTTDTSPPTFPDHVPTFVFPDGCRPSVTSHPPSFFTLVLTNGSGERLYVGVLCLYDDDRDTMETLQTVLDNSNYPKHLRPAWLSSSSSSKHDSSSHKPCSTKSTTSDVLFLPKCLVLLSHYPFFDLWRNFLLQIYRIALIEAPLPMERFVANFVREVPLPPPGKVQVKFGFTTADIWTIERPPENQLPLANFSFRPLFACLSVSNVLVVIGCLLQEIRVVLLSKHYALLGPVAEALLSFLFPFHWQGMVLTIVPRNMLDILDAPVPYLVGMNADYLKETPIENRPHGVVFVDLDLDEIHLGFNDNTDTARSIPALPDRDAGKLKGKLEEFASMAYVLPNTQVPGSITCGTGQQIPSNERETYAQISSAEIPSDSNIRRKDIFPSTDKAYRDNELLAPISGFLSEHGQISQKESFNDDDDESPQGKRKKGRIPMLPKALRGRRNISNSNHDSNADTSRMQNLLDMKEPSGFSSKEIREAFLRFFVSLFREYKNFLDNSTFRSDDFVMSLNLSKSCAKFVSSLLATQMFQVFTVERCENPNDPEVLFFNDSIIAKTNRSKKSTLAGGKKETRFLDDTRSMVTETYTPPPPSNWGLESGKSYHYGSFPTLREDLFGEIRPPRMWHQSRRSSLRMTRRMSVSVLSSERKVVDRANLSLLANVTRRGVKNLEGALKALSTPFVPPSRAATFVNNRKNKQSPKGSEVSDLTLPSSFDMNEDMFSSAEGLILNARRKQAILIGIVMKVQALYRQYLSRKRKSEFLRGPIVALPRPDEHDNRSNREIRAATMIQSFLLCITARIRFKRMQRSAIRLQAFKRWRSVFLAFQILIPRIAKVQALFRGIIVRKILKDLVAERLGIYRHHIFLLWQKADTPLSYRSKFWPLIQPNRLLRLIFAENECERLWNELKIEPPQLLQNGVMDGPDSMRAGIQLGIRNGPFLKCLKISETITSIKKPGMQKKGKHDTSNGGLRTERVIDERMQVYERLSLPIPTERYNKIFTGFSILTKEKHKKVTLANILWCNYEEASQSGELIQELFPELCESTDIIFVPPSRKALRRFPSSKSIQPPLDRSMWAHRILDDRIRRNVSEIADISLRIVPILMIRLQRKSVVPCNVAMTRLIQSIMISRNILDESTARIILVQEKLCGRKSPLVNSTKTTDVSSNAYPGENFWERDPEESNTIGMKINF